MKKIAMAALMLLSGRSGKKVPLVNDKAIYKFDNESSTRWSSSENINGTPGAGGKENDGGKGHPY